MEYFNKKLIQEGMNQTPEFSDMIEQIRKETEYFCERFEDSPSKLSQWGHHDFCAHDGGKLIFDIEKPYSHICEICGRDNQSELLDGVWVYNYRNEAVMNIWKSAFLYKYTKEEKYLKYVHKILNFYKSHYLEFQLHNKEGKIFKDYETMQWGAGRIMPQGLNEAIITIRIINALELIKTDLTKGFLADLKENFFDEVVKLLKPQVDKIHNISCWKNSAIGMIGLFFEDQDCIDFAFDGKYNIYKQIEKGVTNDGFWFEGSIHYNFFTLEGIINLLLFSELYDFHFRFDLKEKIRYMLNAAYNYSFDNHMLPNPNDGWPNINLKTYSYIYAIGSKIFGVNSDIANLLKLIERNPIQRGELPLSKPYYYQNKYSLERLILVPDLNVNEYHEVERTSINFTKSQYAMLRNDDVNVFLKYGHNGPSHAHPDKMNIEVLIKNQMLTRDLSNAGYGNKYCDEWHRVTASHNTVVINGQNQKSMEKGKTLFFGKDKMSFKADNVYGIKHKNISKLKTTMNQDEVLKYLRLNYGLTPAEIEKMNKKGKFDLESFIKDNDLMVNYIRTIELNDKGYNDEFLVYSKDYVCMDLFMHIQGELLTPVEAKEDSLEFTSNGYQHIHNIKKIGSKSSKFTLKWKVGNLILSYTTNLKNKTLYLADTYDNPITESRKTLILRYKGKRTIFNQEWKVEEIVK